MRCPNHPPLSQPTVNLRTVLKTLLVVVLGMPLLSVVLSWVVGLLAVLGDAAGASAFKFINTAVQVLWLVSLIGLVVVLALEALEHSREE